MIASQCPEWAKPIIEQIYALEIKAGNILPDEKWHTRDLESLHHNLTDDSTDALFERLVKGLHSEGLNTSQISELINANIPTRLNLPYCDADAVDEILHT